MTKRRSRLDRRMSVHSSLTNARQPGGRIDLYRGGVIAALIIRVALTEPRRLPVYPGGLNRSTQHSILEEKMGVWDGAEIS